MKIYYIIISLFLFATTACVDEVDDIFSESANKRIQREVKECNQLLLGSENGWIVEYFAQPETEGYTFLLKFDSPDKVTASILNFFQTYQLYTDESFYQVKAEDGPMLSFDTYNDVIHLFSDPEYGSGMPGFDLQLGTGFGGDYEFSLMKMTQDTITFRGRKRGTTILFSRMPENTDWEEYLNRRYDLTQYAFSNPNSSLTLYTGENEYKVTNGSKRIFNILPRNSSEGAIAISAPFVVNETGIRFHSPITIDGKTMQMFYMNEDKTEFISQNDPDVKIGGPDLGDLIYNSVLLWKFDSEAMDSSLNDVLDRITQACKTRFGGNEVIYGFKTYNNGQQLALNIDVVIYSTSPTGTDNHRYANLYFDLQLTDKNQISLVYSGNGDTNGKAFYNSIDGVSELVDNMLPGNILLSTDNLLNPSLVKAQNKDNNIWFTLVSPI